MKVGSDVDGVLACWLGACALLIKKENNIDIWPHIVRQKFTNKTEELLLKYQYTVEMYDWLNPIPYAAKALEELTSLGVELVYITARPKSTKDTTIEWLDRHGFPSAKLINVRDSKVPAVSREKVDYFIEDRLEYANDIAAEGTSVILLDVYMRKWKRNLGDNIKLVYNWNEVMDIILEDYNGRLFE